MLLFGDPVQCTPVTMVINGYELLDGNVQIAGRLVNTSDALGMGMAADAMMVTVTFRK